MAQKLNTENLKQTLWEALQNVRSGDMDIGQANAMIRSATALISVIRTELRVCQLLDEKPNKNVIDVLNVMKNIQPRNARAISQ